MHDRLFDQFFTTKEQGLGMGLAIVRSIVEAHGGEIEAENVADGGARFYFTLPVTKKLRFRQHDGGERSSEFSEDEVDITAKRASHPVLSCYR